MPSSVPFMLGLDLLGGDHPPEMFIPALVTVLEESLKKGVCAEGLYSKVWRLVIFATPSFVEQWRSGPHAPYLNHPTLSVVEVQESVQMEDLPLHAVRKKHSSLMQGITMLREKQLDAFISTGNTGAFVAAATLQLPLLPGVRRLGLLARVPTRGGITSVIDVGATLEPIVTDLMQWTELAAEHLRRNEGVFCPRVGLLNIGSESYKGTSFQQEVFLKLSNCQNISFLGNVESEEVYQGAVDLLVTDGYSGNIFIKTSEAVKDFVYFQMAKEGFIHKEEPKNLCAYLLGTPFCLVKCHGAMLPHLLLQAVKEVIQTHL